MILALAALVIIAWITGAPDARTASIRSGAAGAIGSGARAAGQSIRADYRSAKAARSGTTSARRRARLARWAGKATDAKGNPIPAPRSGRFLLALDRVLSEAGPIGSAGRSIGSSMKAAGQAARVGYQSGRENAQTGMPKSIRDRLPTRKKPAVDPNPGGSDAGPTADIPEPTKYVTCPSCGGAGCEFCDDGSDQIGKVPDWVADPNRPDWPGEQNDPHTPPAPSGSEKEDAVSNTPTADIPNISALLAAAEQIERIAGDIGTELLSAAETAQALPDALAFDPGPTVVQPMHALAEAAPDPDTLRAFIEAAPAFAAAVRERIAQLAILGETEVKGHTDQLTPA